MLDSETSGWCENESDWVAGSGEWSAKEAAREIAEARQAGAGSMPMREYLRILGLFGDGHRTMPADWRYLEIQRTHEVKWEHVLPEHGIYYYKRGGEVVFAEPSEYAEIARRKFAMLVAKAVQQSTMLIRHCPISALRSEERGAHERAESKLAYLASTMKRALRKRKLDG